MIQDIKALVVVLGLTVPIWMLARRLFAPFSSTDTFDRRRNVWLAVTVLGFLSPSIWLYALLAVPIMAWAAHRDPNPAALYVLLLYAVPPVAVPIPSIVINQVFDVGQARLLAAAVLLPAALRLWRSPSDRDRKGLDAMDGLLLGFMALNLVLFVPYESTTNSMRRVFLLGLDALLLFYVFSRLGSKPAAIRDCMVAWLMAGLLMAPVAIFETLRNWLLYVGIAARWGDSNEFAWLLRGDRLRAQASAGHSLPLWYWLAIAWCFFLLAQRYWTFKWARYAAGTLLLGGLWASFARGAWLTTLLITLLFLALDPKGAAAGLKSAVAMVLVSGLLVVSPLGDRIVDYLPFLGTVDAGSVEYRKQLFESSWLLIQQHPFLGNPFVMTQLESLRQGQGIIDLINGYLQIALFYGLIGLGLFVGILALAVKRGSDCWRRVRHTDVHAAYVGSALIAAMVGSMFFIATASYGLTTYILAGLLASYWRAFGPSATVLPRMERMQGFPPLAYPRSRQTPR